jgi:NAD(P)H-dependent FMN reductase
MIVLISGTNRSPSETLRVTKIYEALFKKEGAETRLLDLSTLPAEVFTPRASSNKPNAFIENFLEPVLKADGLFVVTPEYNGSFPGALKLFIDMLKFPESFEKKPVAFAGLASGMWGAIRPVEHLEGVFKYRNAFLFNERIFLPRIQDQIDSNGNFTQPLVAQLVDSQVKNFIRFCKAVKS